MSCPECAAPVQCACRNRILFTAIFVVMFAFTACTRIQGRFGLDEGALDEHKVRMHAHTYMQMCIRMYTQTLTITPLLNML